jgi:hypothetical protein
LLRLACSMSHCMRSFDRSSSLLFFSGSPLALASWIIATRLATSGSNMFTILLRQYQVGRLRMGMINRFRGPGTKDRKTTPVRPKHIHHFCTTSKYRSLRHTGRPMIMRLATPQTALRTASLTKTCFQPSVASSPLRKCLSNVYRISSKTLGRQTLICLVRSLRMTVKSWIKALLGP